jgi:hypothetical protein
MTQTKINAELAETAEHFDLHLSGNQERVAPSGAGSPTR